MVSAMYVQSVHKEIQNKFTLPVTLQVGSLSFICLHTHENGNI